MALGRGPPSDAPAAAPGRPPREEAPSQRLGPSSVAAGLVVASVGERAEVHLNVVVGARQEEAQEVKVEGDVDVK